MIDNSYYIILNRLKAFANGHYLINTFTYHEIANFDISKNPEYPIMHAVPVSMNPVKGAINYSFDITFASWVRAKEEKQENEVTVISDMHRCALDLVTEITNGNILFGDEVRIDGDAVILPFIDEFANVLSGVTLQLTIQIPYDWSACDIPANWVEGTGDIPDFGGRSLTLDVLDEGTFVVAAREMNFVGSGVTVTYTGNRAIVTINGGSGGGAVDSVNGQTGVVVLDASDVGADAAGSAASALASANSYTDGVVSALTYSDVGADQAGAAASALSSANSYTDSEIAALTAADVGLGNVDNTSDLDKPISTETQAAIDAIPTPIYLELIRTGSTVPSLSTRYAAEGLAGFATSLVVTIAPKKLFTTFRVFITTAQSANNTITTIRKFYNVAGTEIGAQTLVIPAGSVSGIYKYTGATFDMSSTNGSYGFTVINAATASSANLNSIESVYQ